MVFFGEYLQLKKIWEISPEELQFDRIIDSGAYGDVWFARWGVHDVAVKRLNDKLFMFDEEGTSSEFQAEVSFMRSIRHRNIVLFLGAGSIDGVPFLVTEYLQRGSLRKILDDKQTDIPLSRCMSMALDAACGMDFLHSLTPPRIHRDLKAANLLVGQQYLVKVADFGTSRLLSQLDRKTLSKGKAMKKHRTKKEKQLLEQIPLQPKLTGLVGTRAWMSPELMDGAPYGPPVDVYSYGVVLWEIITREHPWSEFQHDHDLDEAVLTGQRPLIPMGCHRQWAALIQQCWDGNATARPTFADVCVQLIEMAAQHNARNDVPGSASDVGSEA